MKKITVILALAIACVQLSLNAQYNYTPALLRQKNANPFRHHFDIYLGYENHLLIDLTSMKLLPELWHTDSILRQAMQDIAAAMKVDSALHPTDTKKIGFLIDSSGFKTMQVQYIDKGKSYAFDKGELAYYKFGQDTVIINRLYKPLNKQAPRGSFEEWQLTLVIDGIENFKDYSGKTLDSTIETIAGNYAAQSGWNEKNDQQMSVNARYTAGDAAAAKPVYYPDNVHYNLSLWGEVAVQNRSQAFLISLVYPTIEFYYTRNLIKTKWALEPETFFIFEKTPNGNMSIFPNTFLNLSFSRKIAGDRMPLPKWSGLFRELSVGMLVKAKGNYFEKNSFKIKLGGLSYKSLSVNPQFFFHDFFKQAQPSLRVALAF